MSGAGSPAGARVPAVLSIHAVDTLGEDGIVADARVCHELGCRWSGAVTAVVAAAPDGVDALEPLSLGLLAQQLESVLKVCRPAAIRTGVLAGERQVELVAEVLREYDLEPPVVAPTIRVRGVRVLDDAGLEAVRRHLFPLAGVLVVRAVDLGVFGMGGVEDVESLALAAADLRSRGAPRVLIAGAVQDGRVLDLLDDGGRTSLFDVSKVSAPRMAGLAGAHATALAAHLARRRSLTEAVDAAQRYVGLKLQRPGGFRPHL